MVRAGRIAEDMPVEFEDQIGDVRLVELYRYWRSLPQNLFAPSRRAIDPTSIPKLLPNILLVDVVGAGPYRYRYRLAGSDIEYHLGRKMGGRYVDEVMPGDYGNYIISLYDLLVAQKRPIYSESEYSVGRSMQPSGSIFRAKRLMLPLSADGQAADTILTGQVFFSNRSRDPSAVLIMQDSFHVVAPAA